MTALTAVEPVVVGVSPRTNWTFIAVTTAAGDTGWGECSLNGWEPLLVAYAGMLARDLVGCAIDGIGGRLRYVPHSPGGLVAHAVKSAVEQACTDVSARRAGHPVCAFIGAPQRDSIPAYANINRGVTERSPEGFAAAAARACAAGYRAVKIAPFDGVIAADAATTPIAARIGAGLDRVFAVRAAIGNDCALLVDCHWRFDEPRAAALIRDLAPAAPYWIECPISEHPAQFAAIARLRRLARERGARLAGGEAIVGPDQAEAMCAAALYDVLMPDIKYAGGFRGMLAIAEVCAAHGVAVSPHNPTGPIAHLASVHACAATPSVLWLEHQWGESPLFNELVGGEPAPLAGGGFAVPRAPGLGAVLDRALAARHPALTLPREANLDERLG